MPSYIVKAARDQDWYVLWSTVVDAPTAWGTRAEMAEYLTYEENAPQRWERADERGTSANWPGWTKPQVFGWEDAEFILMEAGPARGDMRDGCWLLRRANLREFCERLERGEDATDLCRWESHEDDHADDGVRGGGSATCHHGGPTAQLCKCRDSR